MSDNPYLRVNFDQLKRDLDFWQKEIVDGEMDHYRILGAGDPLRQGVRGNIISRLKRLRPGRMERLRAIQDPAAGEITDDPAEVARITKTFWEKRWEGNPTAKREWARQIRDYRKRIPGDIDFDLDKDQIQKVMQASSNTSSGPDGIPFAAYRRIAAETAEHIHEMLAYIAQENSQPPPADFNLCNLALLPKKVSIVDDLLGNVYQPGNLRPISIGHCFNRVLSNCVRIPLLAACPQYLETCSKGFTPERFIADAIYRVNDFLCQKVSRKHQSLLLLVDFESAFSTMDPEFIRIMLLKVGFNRSFVKQISILWDRVTHVCPFGGRSSRMVRSNRALNRVIRAHPYYSS